MKCPKCGVDVGTKDKKCWKCGCGLIGAVDSEKDHEKIENRNGQLQKEIEAALSSERERIEAEIEAELEREGRWTGGICIGKNDKDCDGKIEIEKEKRKIDELRNTVLGGRSVGKLSELSDTDLDDRITAFKNGMMKIRSAEVDNMIRSGQGLNGVDVFAIIASVKDASTRDKLVEAYLGEIEARMKPEVILAAMAKRGNNEAQARIDNLDKKHKEHLEKTVEDNKQMYQTVMNMNERMFNQMTEKMTRPDGGSVSTTHVIKQD